MVVVVVAVVVEVVVAVVVDFHHCLSDYEGRRK